MRTRLIVFGFLVVVLMVSVGVYLIYAYLAGKHEIDEDEVDEYEDFLIVNGLPDNEESAKEYLEWKRNPERF